MIKQIEDAKVFLNPMRQLTLASGEILEYPELMGMTKEAETLIKYAELAKLLKIDVEDAIDVSLIQEAFSKIKDNISVVMVNFQDIISMIIAKDEKWVDANLELIDGIEIVIRFYLPKQKKMMNLQKKVYEILGINTSMPSPAESGDGVKSEQEEPQKK